MHEEKTTWNLTSRGHFPLAVVDGRIADASAKQGAERSQTLEADFKANVSHAQTSGKKQLFGFLNSPVNQVLVRRGFERIPKKPEKVVTRQTSLL